MFADYLLVRADGVDAFAMDAGPREALVDVFGAQGPAKTGLACALVIVL